MLHSTSDLYGASRIFLQTAEILQNAGSKVFVFLSEKGPLSIALENLGIEVHILRLGILRRKYINIPGIINRAFFTANAAWKIHAFIRRHSINLVYNNAASIFAGIIAAKISGTKHIWHIHEIILSPNPFARLIARLMANSSDLNIYVSDATYKYWTGLNNKIQKRNKAIRIRNGIEVPITLDAASKYSSKIQWKIPINDETVVIGMIGRINHWKGQLYFLDIAHEILKKNKNIHFIMAGDTFPGYEYILDDIKEKINTLEISSYITDIGFQANTFDFYQSIDLLIVPSTLPDPLPTVVLEAMAYEKPVAGTAHGGIVEMIIHDETGIHIPVNDAKTAAEKIMAILNKQKLRFMGEKGLEYLNQEFSHERYKSLILSSIEKILHDQL